MCDQPYEAQLVLVSSLYIFCEVGSLASESDVFYMWTNQMLAVCHVTLLGQSDASWVSHYWANQMLAVVVYVLYL